MSKHSEHVVRVVRSTRVPLVYYTFRAHSVRALVCAQNWSRPGQTIYKDKLTNDSLITRKVLGHMVVLHVLRTTFSGKANV